MDQVTMKIIIKKITSEDGVFFYAYEGEKFIRVELTLEKLEEYIERNKDLLKHGKIVEEIKTIEL